MPDAQRAIPRATATEVLRVLGRDGWVVDRRSGSHVILKHNAKKGLVIVAMHKQAELTPEEFWRLL